LVAALVVLWLPSQGLAEVPQVTVDCIGMSQGQLEPLSGSWSFDWMQFERVPSWKTADEPLSFIQVPSLWSSHPEVARTVWPHFGYATYRVEIVFKGLCPKELGIDFKSVRSAYNAFLVWPDGKSQEALSVGWFSSDPHVTIHQHRRSILPLEMRAFDRVQLVLQVAKFKGGEGGLNRTPYLGELQYISGRKQMDAQRHFFVMGILIFVAFYHFSLYRSRREDRSSLYFALTCLVMFARFFVVHGFIDLWFAEPHQWLYRLKVQIDFASYALVLLVCYQYITTLFTDMMWRPWMNIMTGSSLLVILATPFASVLDLSSSLKYIHIIFAVTSLCALYGLLRAVWHRRAGARRLTLGFVVIMLAGVNDAFAGADVITTPMLSPLGIIIFIFINARIIADRHSNALEVAEHLTLNLETEVEKKTEELEARTWEAEQAQEVAVLAQEKVEELNRDITENVLKRYLPPKLIDEILEGDRKMNDSPKHLDDGDLPQGTELLCFLASKNTTGHGISGTFSLAIHVLVLGS